MDINQREYTVSLLIISPLSLSPSPSVFEWFWITTVQWYQSHPAIPSTVQFLCRKPVSGYTDYVDDRFYRR